MSMENPTRFEMTLPADRRRALDNLAREIGTNSADLARLAITRLLNGRDALVGVSDTERAA
jgi:hypothetical protein